jgi:hypothetical protein
MWILLCRRLAAAALLLPLSLSGVGMVCLERPAARATRFVAASVSPPGHCGRVCVVSKPGARLGARESAPADGAPRRDVICLSTGRGDGPWSGSAAADIAMPVSASAFHAGPMAIRDACQELAACYVGPARATLTPPPKA